MRDMASKKKLSALRMPSSRKNEMEFELNLGDEDMPEEDKMADAEMGEEDMMMEDDSKSPSPAADLSDDELLAEIKKRGLMADLQKSEEEGEGEMEEDYSMM